MITCVCMNPCIDRTAVCASFDPASANRIRTLREDIGGKGINASVAVTHLGGEACAVVAVPDQSRSLLEAFWLSSGFAVRPVSLPGHLRINLKIRTSDGQTIEINEEGAPMPQAALAQAEQEILALAGRSSFVLLTGSLPPGVPPSWYASLVRTLQRNGHRCAVDADGEALRLAVAEKPDLIKPNRQEFARLTGLTPSSPEEAAARCAELRAGSGVGAVCLSLGGDGAVLSCGSGCFFAPAVEVPIRSLHGAGDSMLAALCLKAESLGFCSEALRFASAAAAASVLREGTGMCTYEDTLALLPKASCTTLSP